MLLQTYCRAVYILIFMIKNGHYVAMPVQYELRRLFHLMNIQMHRNSTQKVLF